MPPLHTRKHMHTHTLSLSLSLSLSRILRPREEDAHKCMQIMPPTHARTNTHTHSLSLSVSGFWRPQPSTLNSKGDPCARGEGERRTHTATATEHIAKHCNKPMRIGRERRRPHDTPHCNTHRTATHTALQHVTEQHSAEHPFRRAERGKHNTLHHTATQCTLQNTTLQHTATPCNTPIQKGRARKRPA